MVAIENHGETLVYVTRDGTRHPITFTSSPQAAAWFGRAQTGILARRDELSNPIELRNLGDTLSDMATRPWATDEHLCAVLVTSLIEAGVNSMSLERHGQGLELRCRRFGHIQLGGRLSARAGALICERLTWHLHGATSGLIDLEGRFPGPRVSALAALSPGGIQIKPQSKSNAGSDLSSWIAASDDLTRLRELFSLDTGLILIVGRGDSGKTSFIEVCEREAEVLRRHQTRPVVMDEVNDDTGASEALKRAERNLVFATIRAESVGVAFQWLRSVGMRRTRLTSLVKAAIETQLIPVECQRCGGEGCQRCQRSGISHRRVSIAIAELPSALKHANTAPHFERERRKLTA